MYAPTRHVEGPTFLPKRGLAVPLNPPPENAMLAIATGVTDKQLPEAKSAQEWRTDLVGVRAHALGGSRRP